MAITFTATELLRRSYQLVGVIGPVDPLSAQLGQDGLVILNAFLDTLTTQRQAMPAISRDVFSTTNNQSTYTVGPSANFNMTRPVTIDYANVLDTSTSPSDEIPMAALSEQSYAALSIKGQTAPFPVNYFYNLTNTGTGSLFLWPTPTQSSVYQIVLYTPTALTGFSALTTSATMNPGYYRMLYYNVGLELAMAYARPFDARIAQMAERALADAKRMNLQMMDLDTSASLPGTQGIYNSYSDTNY